MPKILLVLLSYLFIYSSFLNAQNIQRCATVEKEKELINNDPSYLTRRSLINNEFKKWKEQANLYRSSNIFTIPVVVHVLYENNTQNISDAQIASQIAVLNEDYRLLNSDTNLIPSPFKSVAADCQIEFCLATKDPNGSSTNGITRKQTSVNSIGNTNSYYKSNQGGQDIWDRDKYLNIWVCNLGGGLLGFAMKPGGQANKDGVVIDYRYFGNTGTVVSPYNKGRTATHEVGHWLDLDHIWGDSNCGNDNINDTPIHQSANYGCPSFPKTNSCQGASQDGEMFMNYMDYVDDGCMQMFTSGQKSKMQYTLNNSRSSLFNQTLCQNSSVVNDAGVSAILEPGLQICEGEIELIIKLKNHGSANLTSVDILYLINSGSPSTYQWSGNLSSGQETTVNLGGTSINAGSNTLEIYTSNPNGQADGNGGNDSQNITINTISSSPSSLPIEESFESSQMLGANWSIKNPDNSFTWEQNSNAIDGSYSAFMNNYDYNSPGQEDDLISPFFDLSLFSWPRLTFKHAYSLYSNTYPDTLTVLITNDCGITNTIIYQKYGSALSTTQGFTQQAFVPNQSQWAGDTIMLNAFISFDKAQLIFRNTNKYGNNLYLDHIMIDGANNISYLNTTNPIEMLQTKEHLKFYFKNSGTAQWNIELYNMLGQRVFQKESSNSHILVKTNQLLSGIYIALVRTANNQEIFNIKL